MSRADPRRKRNRQGHHCAHDPRASPWKTGPWVKVNCPAIPGTLLESELFGYEKGAFTGAYGVKPGRVEMAHRGTLFLDEISELDMGLQSKLLQLCRMGSSAASAPKKTRKSKSA